MPHPRILTILLSAFLALLAGLLLLPVLPVLAAGPVVNTAADDESDGCAVGNCTLREAIAAAANGETITFAGSYTIYLNSQLNISRTVTVDGQTNAVTISGDTKNDGSTTANVRGFYIEPTGVVTLNHLSVISGLLTVGSGGGIYNVGGALTVQNSTVAGGSAASGGGIFNYSGPLTVQNSTLVGNSAGNGGGGGIFNSSGTVMVQNSTLVGNRATNSSRGGGIYNYNGTVTVQNSTLANNSAAQYGGGIASTPSSTMIVQNSTLANNSAVAATGIFNWSTLYLSNTLIASSFPGGDCYTGLTIATNDHNLIQDGSCSPAFSGDPLLTPLGNNGGTTQTFALLPGSPAIDAGNNATCLDSDQRDIARSQGTACDIGAFESQGFTFTYGSGSPQSADINTAFVDPLVLTVSSNAGEPVNGGQVVFTGPGSGTGINPSVYTATLSGGAASQVITANNTGGSYVVTATARGNLGSPVSYNLTNLAPDMAVLGNGAVIADDDTIPSLDDYTDFGSTTLGGAITRTFTISNSGALALILTGAPLVSLTGPAADDFSLVVSPTTPLNPNLITTFQVRFVPTAKGTRVATVTIANNDSDENPYNFAIQGTEGEKVYIPFILKTSP